MLPDGPHHRVSGGHGVYFRRPWPYYAVEEWQGIATIPAAGGDSVVSERGETREASTPAPTVGGRLYLTGELRAQTGLPRTHMDFYLREGIIQPTTRTGSGYLLFDDAELETLRAVLRWREEGVGIREIRGRLGRPAPQ